MTKEEFNKLFEGVEIPEDKLNAAFSAHEASLVIAHSEVTNTTLSGVDAKMKAEVGIEKNQGEKSADYYVRVLSAIKENAVTEYTETIEQLKADLVKAKESNTSTPEEVRLLQEQLLAKSQELETTKTEYSTKETEREFNSKVESILGGFKVNPTYDENVAKIYMNSVRDSAKSVKTIKVGEQEIVLSADGITPMLKDGKPVTFADHLTSQLSNIAAPQAPAGTGGTDTTNQASGSAIVGSPKNKLEAYELVESHYNNPNEREKQIGELMNDANYKALPEI